MIVLYLIYIYGLLTQQTQRPGTLVAGRKANRRGIAQDVLAGNIIRDDRVSDDGIGHEVTPANEAEDDDAVVLVEDAQCTQHFAQGGAAGGDIVDDEHILLADMLTEFSVGL